MERGLGDLVMRDLFPTRTPHPPVKAGSGFKQSLGSDTLGPSPGRTVLTFSELHNPYVLICEITYLPHT